MKIAVKKTKLFIMFEGLERLWALKTHLILDISDITDIQWSKMIPEKVGLKILRAPGTSLPTKFHAGSFYTKDGWEFWYLLMKQPGELIITTNKKRYHKLRLSCSENYALKARSWFNEYQKTRNIA